jgi:glycosyltransferase involved in cell wall biosynthesis
VSARLGYLLKRFPRLSETFVLGEILGQEALGRELVVYSRRTPEDEPRHPELARLRAEVLHVPSSNDLDPFGLLLDGAARDEASLERLGALLARLRPLGVPRLSKLVAEALWLLADTRARGVEHLHAHFATESAIVAHLAHGLGGPSYSITAHAKDIYCDDVDPRLLDELFAHSAFTVTVCEANVAHLERRLGAAARARVRHLYNGIDRAAFEGLARRPVPGRILSIGRFVAKKGFDTLLAALAVLDRRGVPFTCEIVGDGEDRAELADTLTHLRLDRRVRLLGPLPADRVRERLAEASVFALPCRVAPDGNRDALPTVLLEAQAARVPLVSCPVGGVAEILDHGRAGVLVPENDAEALADAMARVLLDPGAHAGLVERGAALGRVEFDRARQAQRLSEWFDAALAAREVSTCTSPT